jgi:hypothetical protein
VCSVPTNDTLGPTDLLLQNMYSVASFSKTVKASANVTGGSFIFFLLVDFLTTSLVTSLHHHIQ